MPEAVIVAACRTAIGTSFKGSLTETPAIELASAVIGEAVQRSGLDPGEIDDVIFGEVMQGGGDIARHAALRAGLVSAPGLAAQRQCASSRRRHGLRPCHRGVLKFEGFQDHDPERTRLTLASRPFLTCRMRTLAALLYVLTQRWAPARQPSSAL